MGQPHKHAELIKAWADGADIQVWDNHDEIWRTLPKPTWDSNLYRIKPKTIRYRNFLWTSSVRGKTVVSIVSEEGNKNDSRENWDGFVRWLGDWQEVEV